MDPPGDLPSSSSSHQVSILSTTPQSHDSHPPIAPAPIVKRPQEWSTQEHIIVDTDSDDDSAVGGFSDVSSTASARPSVYDFLDGEDGRRYHRFRQGRYIMPNDEPEQDRLNFQHQIWLMTLDNKLSIAPLKKDPHHVLDLATGTGIWAIEFALEHPTAAVIGNDLSPIQPESIPVNCTFEVEDIEDEWTYSQRFDLIHGRLLLSCLGAPKRLFEQAFTGLAPGGFFEMQDTDCPAISQDSSLDGTALEKWYDKAVEGASIMGRELGITKKYKTWMEEVGFVNVEEKLFYWPINTWPKDPHMKKIGLWFQEDLLGLVNNFQLPFIKALGWTLEELKKFQVEVKKDVHDRRIHAYQVIRVVFGMKPE